MPVHQIAMLGTGRIGKIHAANAMAVPRIALKYVVDPFEDSARQMAQGTGAAVASLEDVLADPGIAGIVVASSTDMHLEHCLRAIAAGKKVFCEKPIDLDLARVQSEANCLAGADVPLFIGFNRRFDPHFRALRERIAGGGMGAVETLHIISHDPAPPHPGFVEKSGGLFRDMMIHDFDMARWLLGEEPTQIFASGSCLVDPAIGAAGDIDTAKCVLRTASGQLCVISNTRRSGYGYDQRVEAFCSGGMVKLDNVKISEVSVSDERGATTDPIESFFLQRYAAAYREEMIHFADMMDGTAKPLVGFGDAVKALAIAEAAIDAMASGGLTTIA